MLSGNLRKFLEENHKAVLSTCRGTGASQLSIVLCGAYGEGVGFTTPMGRAKLRNLLVSPDEWWGYVVLEGRAEVLAPGRSDPEELAKALRDIFRTAAGKEHPDWDEYDRAIVDERRAAICVIPEHVYGPASGQP